MGSKFGVACSEDITLKKTSKGASPEMMPLLFGRHATLPESAKKTELNVSKVKTIN